MAKTKKAGTASLVLFAVTIVGMILAVVGICLNFVQTTTTVLGISGSATSPLFGEANDFFNGIGNLGNLGTTAFHGFEALQAFAILTILASAATLVFALLETLTNWKLMKLFLILLSIATIAFAVITVILLFTYSPVDLGEAGKVIEVASTPAIGGWLLAAGGVIAGGAGLFNAFAN